MQRPDRDALIGLAALAVEAGLVGAAWLETEATWLINLVPIVRNVYAELLLDAARG